MVNSILNQATAQFASKTTRRGNQYGLGRRVADLLAGAWRESDGTAPTLSEIQLNEILPLLCESGAGALAWWRIRNTQLADTESGQQLHDVYRRHRLSALIHERELACVLALLRAAGIEPVLIKGWAMARLYPDAALRPYGDIDLCIRPDQFADAVAASKCLADLDGHYVDLHSGFSRIGQTRPGDGLRKLGRSRINSDEMRVWDQLYNRSQIVSLESKVQGPKSKIRSEPPASAGGPTSLVRILSDEDHLRILSAHLLRSGARRPPWLCDIALLLEKVQSPKSKVQCPSPARSDFNWDVCLKDRLHDNWVASAVMLAHELLGVDISHTPFAARRAPRWLVPAVLRQWGRSRVQSPMSKVQGPLAAHRLWTLDLGHWTLDSIVGLWTRFDNPIRATAAVGGQFNNWPRLPYRLCESIMRLPELPQRLLANRRTGKQMKREKVEQQGAAIHPTPIASF